MEDYSQTKDTHKDQMFSDWLLKANHHLDG